jgi:hypothetical protein
MMVLAGVWFPIHAMSMSSSCHVCPVPSIRGLYICAARPKMGFLPVALKGTVSTQILDYLIRLQK